PDMQLFGYEVKEPSDRFELAEEWMYIFDRLWAGRESFDYKGTNYNLKAAFSQPHGVQARPVLLNAGRSPRGREFAAKHCDIAFCSAHNPTALKEQIAAQRNEARTKFGKEIQVWMSAYVVLKDTMREAEAYAHDYIVTQGDDAAVQTIIKHNAIDTKSMPPEAAAKLAYALKAGFAGYPLVGDADRIAGLFADLSVAGVDGFLLTWLDYEGGLDRFGREVLPRLEKAGLRAPAAHCIARSVHRPSSPPRRLHAQADHHVIFGAHHRLHARRVGLAARSGHSVRQHAVRVGAGLARPRNRDRCSGRHRGPDAPDARQPDE